jgi:DNA-directed RNA polymerase specialized sigma24 family protein
MIVNRDELERGFRRLSIDHRVVLMLHYYLDMSLDEIAATDARPTARAAR